MRLAGLDAQRLDITAPGQHGMQPPLLFVPEAVIRKAGPVDIAAWSSLIEPMHRKIVDTEALVAVEARISEAQAASDAAAEAVQRAKTPELIAEWRSPRTTPTRRDEIVETWHRLEDAAAAAGRTLNKAGTDRLVVLLSVDEETLARRHDHLVNGVPQADADARAAFAALEEALLRRERGHAAAGWPAPRPGTHWSDGNNVQGNGSNHVQSLLREVRRVVSTFPLYSYAPTDED